MRLFIFALVFLGCTLFPWAHGITESQQQAMVVGGNLSYLWLGAVHMVTGYDHLLFLFGVIFYLSGMRDILKFVTAFSYASFLSWPVGAEPRLSRSWAESPLSSCSWRGLGFSFTRLMDT